MKIYLVGGAVRDELLGLPIKEKDYVVVGATVNDMLHAGFRQVGKEFPVFLHPHTHEEYALARAERKIGAGYKGFSFDTSPDVSLEEDLKRRDLTINAMARDLESKKIIDPYGGQEDIKQKMLHHVSDAFAEDPVRILRVGRFLARYAYIGFSVHADTIKAMKKIVAAGEVNALVAERVWKELDRALSEKNPEKFFAVLDEASALSILFPHLQPQGPGIHALVSASRITQDGAIRFAALFHAYPEEKPDNLDRKKMILEFCHRYRVPNSYQQLAVLTALYFEKALSAKRLAATDLLTLFNALDIYRRERRFKDFLIACQAIAHVKQIQFDPEDLQIPANMVKMIDVQLLIQEGYQGAALAKKLQEQRLDIIEKWLEHKH